MSTIPLVHLASVYHVGSLDPARRASLHRSSQEGPCLSVSLCPEAWTSIARLGGSQLHELRRDSAAFLDVLAAMGDPELQGIIVGWAESEGLVVFREQWKAWRYDDEMEQWGYMLLDTRDEAEEEIDEFSRGPDGGPALELSMGYAATPGLHARLGIEPFDDAFALDFAAMLWARDVAPHLLGRTLDGVWFREDYAPEHRSAPRGGIFPEALSVWTSSLLPPGSVDDEVGLASMPETIHVPSLMPAAACIAGS